jgi:hypothetical protein
MKISNIINLVKNNNISIFLKINWLLFLTYIQFFFFFFYDLKKNKAQRLSQYALELKDDIIDIIDLNSPGKFGSEKKN